MRFVFSNQLKQGMVLATDLKLGEETGQTAALLTQGQRLNQFFITKIRSFGIRGVMVEDSLTDEETGAKDLAFRAKKDITQVFEQFKEKKMLLDEDNVGRIATVAEDVVKQILLKQDFAVHLTELDSYDDYTYRHSIMVAVLCVTLSVKLGLGRKLLSEIALCALLHDIGKMLVPLTIINKPGSLTEEEFAIMKQHPQNAYDHLRTRNLVSDLVLEGILDHHEKYDGSGYPNGKKGADISLFGRILTICDIYDALQSDLPYRKKWKTGDIIEYLMSGADTMFDCDLLATFLKTITPYPDGSLVLLNDGKKAIVTRNNPTCIQRPVVRVINAMGETERRINLLTDLRFMNVIVVGAIENTH